MSTLLLSLYKMAVRILILTIDFHEKQERALEPDFDEAYSQV
jgi:hypothetical protein